jgi:hypothetical protein
MTFEVLGEGLRLFEGWALRDLANLRKRYRDNLKSCFDFFLKTKESRFNIWTSCITYTSSDDTYSSVGSHDGYGRARGLNSFSQSHMPLIFTNNSRPSWLAEVFRTHLDEPQGAFSKSLFNPRRIRGEYLSALQTHVKLSSCVACPKVHTEKGEMFCKDMEDVLTRALNKVCPTSTSGVIVVV